MEDRGRDNSSGRSQGGGSGHGPNLWYDRGWLGFVSERNSVAVEQPRSAGKRDRRSVVSALHFAGEPLVGHFSAATRLVGAGCRLGFVPGGEGNLVEAVAWAAVPWADQTDACNLAALMSVNTPARDFSMIVPPGLLAVALGQVLLGTLQPLHLWAWARSLL